MAQPEADVVDEGPSEEAVEAAPAPEADQAAPEAPEASEASDFDPESVALPKVADLAEFLAGVDNVAHVEALQARDSRKTAAPMYAARIEELS